MKKEKYEKALDIHSDKLRAYSDELFELTERMRDDGCSENDIVGALECCKFTRIWRQAKLAEGSAALDGLGEALDELFGGDGE